LDVDLEVKPMKISMMPWINLFEKNTTWFEKIVAD